MLQYPLKEISMESQRTQLMREGGQALAQVKAGLVSFTKAGASFESIEAEAQRLIAATGAVPSFSTVEGYDWATCLMKNEEMCHGIPEGKTVQNGDVIKIDVGLIWHGYHLDTTTTVVVGQVDPQVTRFLNVSRQALDKAISKVRAGVSVYDVSRAMQKTVEEHGYSMVYQLTGHGVGEELHMDPSIPCIAQRSDKRIKLHDGQTIAVEVMSAMGEADLEVAKDGWTYRTIDGSMAAMFEETVLVTATGHEVLTD